MLTEKNSACAMPPNARPAASTPKPGATATTRLLTVYATRVACSRPLRENRAVDSVSGTASTATMNA
jgi:hypothetical protein